ncbi:MAG: PaaI family thioesterase [Deltaproteobacteria bacterium]|nr:MAG: PaaI family thioesterase [Deltaproteobacteria bacterium]
MPRPPSLPQFDTTIAETFVRASATVTGLPGYLGVRFVEMTAGRLVASMAVRDELLTPFGTLHGGVMAGLVDHVLGCVLYPLMQRGQWAATTEFKLNYLAPVRGGTLVAESTVVSFTKRTAVVRVEVTNEEQLVCVAQGTLLVAEPVKKP